MPGSNNTCECPNGETLRDGKCAKQTTTAAPCPDDEVRTRRGCEKPTTKSAPTLKTTKPLKGERSPPTVKVTTPKLNLAPKPIVTFKPPPKKR